MYLISSDRELVSYARKKGARIIKCADFNKQIRKLFKENKKENSKKEVYPSPLEIKHWSEIFKRKK
jgi:predicted DNA-binding protein (UPF0278 family)